jgi:putative ABC transport system permease protein
MVPLVRTQIQSLDRDQPVFAIRTMEQLVGATLAQRRFSMSALSIFAGAAFLLATIGIYGVISYYVEQRRKEIGIRMALGATAREITRAVVGEGMMLVLIGVVVGVGGALAASSVLASLLFGVEARDMDTYAGVVALLSLAAFVACWLPARRAARMDPAWTLRQ